MGMMGASSLNSAAVINAWNRSSDTVDNGVARRSNSAINYAVENQNEIKNFPEVMLEMYRDEKCMGEAGLFMLKNPNLQFEDFEKASAALVIAKRNNSYSLGAVETYLQKQIDKIIDMDTPLLTPKMKSSCLYFLQEFIKNLGKVKVKNEKTFQPKILEQKDNLLKTGAERGLDINKIENFMYTEEFCVPNDPTLGKGKWKFLDLRKIKKLEEIIKSHISSKELDEFRRDDELNVETIKTQNDMAVYSPVAGGVQESTDQIAGRVLSNATREFTYEQLKADPQVLFRYMQQNLSTFMDRDKIFELTRKLLATIHDKNAEIQASIYQKNNDMGRTM